MSCLAVVSIAETTVGVYLGQSSLGDLAEAGHDHQGSIGLPRQGCRGQSFLPVLSFPGHDLWNEGSQLIRHLSASM